VTGCRSYSHFVFINTEDWTIYVMYIMIYNDIISRNELFYSQRLIPLIYRGRNTKHDNLKMFWFANINIWCHEIFKFNSTQTGKFMTCVIYLYVVILQFCTVHPSWVMYYSVLIYSGVMILIIPQWLRNRQWMKKLWILSLFTIKHLIIMRIQCIVCFQNPLKQTSTFLVKFSIKVKYTT
jgi:hypothetical protein